MPEPYTSYEAIALQYGIAMLANSAAFQAAVGAINATAARAFIIESTGGDHKHNVARGYYQDVDGVSRAAVAPYAIVHMADLIPTLAGIASYDYFGTISIIGHLPRKIGSETAPESLRRARNVAGGIRDDIQNQFGTAGRLATGECQNQGATLPDETGADGDDLIFALAIDFNA